jgi:hypothetical protein
MYGEHFVKTKGYDYYAKVAEKLSSNHDALSEFFMDL